MIGLILSTVLATASTSTTPVPIARDVYAVMATTQAHAYPSQCELTNLQVLLREMQAYNYGASIGGKQIIYGADAASFVRRAHVAMKEHCDQTFTSFWSGKFSD